MSIRLNGVGRSVISPTNQALTKIAQARVESEVARAVKRHENALKVDGSQIYMWLRGNTGLVCTCRQPNSQLEATLENNNPTNEDLREPLKFATGLPAISRSGGFKVITRDSINQPADEFEPNIPISLLNGIVDENNDQLNDSNDPLRDELRSLSFNQTEEMSDQKLAMMLNEGAAVYGGDKTACGICFGTGRTHGYELATGRRLILDASNEYPYTLNGASIKSNTYPHKFYLNKNSTVNWTVDLPSYTKNWLNFTVRDNLNPANSLVLEWFFGGNWRQLALSDLSKTEGTDRTNRQFRVRIVDDTVENATFTHCELIYATMAPLLGQAQPFNYATDYEVKEPLITTEFEILANIPDIPRESVFQDSKFKYLWKVKDVTPKMTENGQIFSIMLSARTVHPSEMLYALKVIYDPLVIVNYRGLEIDEGGLSELNTNNYFDDAGLTLTIPKFG